MTSFIEMLTPLPVKVFEPGDAIIDEEYAHAPLYFLKQGRVLISRGGVSICEVSEPGAIFGELSFLLSTPATATVKALDRSELYYAENAEQFLREYPDTLLEVSRQLAQRLIAIDRHFVESKNAFDELLADQESSPTHQPPPPTTENHPLVSLWQKTQKSLVRYWHGAKD
ncbi:cyclic nucleotide-binding domain-containing protein [Kamptonema cortianum]|uniref:Cyclic nucleotide-binding domain-containing protein n=1 Tax=Geitlerinema calcuttense NRMC-F 0142 TaxID=2922238 RepID=A0ABT7LY13_9CYAN|nr:MULTISPECIES: cyclic nucleotide-binding domain-containing protein [Cyanophyceae]MDK3157484.1 cyclic nucleotide-binding domain-containing protein [Kamptonema cortianum]MDL5052599.1 cyclic nucleotide-binding domain-containing protein [Oscillatoria laete-virens NRMC-F 0139]MDL5056902.1 cyclic nucleotide-binding domain-containing protein [Geitlerinema calcuttense NRMC-F 0142]